MKDRNELLEEPKRIFSIIADRTSNLDLKCKQTIHIFFKEVQISKPKSVFLKDTDGVQLGCVYKDKKIAVNVLQ